MTLSRRNFIQGTIATSAVAAATRGCGNTVDAAPIVDAEVNDDPTSTRYGQVPVPVPKYPELVPVGGAVMLRIKALPEGARPFTVPERGVLLVHRGSAADPPEFVATRADCPHLGCPLGYNPESKLIECPCHSSRFRAVADPNDKAQCAGLVMHAPAKDNLTVYAARTAGDFVFVDLRTDLSCGVATDFPPVVNGTITVPVNAYPALGMVGGSLIGKPAGLDDKLIVARTAQDKMVCLSAICPHRGCTVGLEADRQLIHCPCHDSEYSYEGAILQGPQNGDTTSPLKQYEVAFTGDAAVITIK